MKILVIDIGGSHVKLMFSGSKERRRFDSGEKFTPRQLVRAVNELTTDWTFDAVSIGFPAPIVNNKPAKPPHNLGTGWFNFDFEKAFKKPVKVMNDAAMQALGSYEGGRMLFLGLGTGLGSALVWEGTVIPLELSELHYTGGQTYEDRVSKRTLKKVGQSKWETAVFDVVGNLKSAFMADYVMLGGGNVKKIEVLPAGVRRGINENAMLGGLRLWDVNPVDAGLKKRPTKRTATRAVKS